MGQGQEVCRAYYEGQLPGTGWQAAFPGFHKATSEINCGKNQQGHPQASTERKADRR